MGNQSGPLSLTELSEADETGTTVGDSVSEENIEGNGEKVFELRHFSVIIPTWQVDGGHWTHSIW